MNTYPKAAGGVSMLEPSIIHAKYQPRQNEKPPAIPSFVGFSTPKSPTRFYEDPKFYRTAPPNLESRSRYQTSTRRLVLVSRGARARGGEQTSIGTLRPAVSSACRKFSERTQLHRAGVNHRDRR